MVLESIGAVLLVLVVVFLFARVWFHFVEAIFGGLKRIFSRKTEPPAWHPLSQEDEHPDQPELK